MEFRLLGPLEARSEARALPLGGPKQKSVLALLLLSPNRVVSKDTLIDAVWGEQPPKEVAAALQNAIFRLRQVLGEERIAWRAPGYVLYVDADDVDALQFERLLDASEALEPPERAAALREGLALWRGAPLADLTFEAFAQPEIARLDELRLVAHERLFEAELDLGRHEAVLAEIEALAARHPTRERLRELQMLALYRAGRQRDALRVYVETRQELVELWGLEPGEGLRELERMILAQDPVLRPPAPATSGRPDELRRNAVVLLMNVVGPENDERIAPFLTEIATIVRRHEGIVRGPAPDDVVAVFGPPRPHEDDTLRALRAASAVREAVPRGFAVRAAIERLAGGANGPADFESLRLLLAGARADDLLLGPAALQVVPAAVDVVPHESGSGYRVLRFDPDAEPFARHLDAPLIGRSAELERLGGELAEVARSGLPRRVVLVGEPGIGKTRLAREFVARHGADATTLTARSRGDADRAATLPMLDVLRQLGPLEPLLAGEPDADRILASLDERPLGAHGESAWAFRRVLEVSAAGRPLVVLLEDVHLAAPAFLDLVEYLSGWTSAPLLLLCVARPELLAARPDWRDEAVFLGPMERVEAERLVELLPGSAALDDRTTAGAVTAAEGNPLFLEQLVAFAADDRSRALPPTLEALIASRVDQLRDDERQVLERAAVAGRHFWRSTVEAVSPPGEVAAVAGVLMALVRRRLVRAERALLPGEDGFCFHHALIREVVYGAIPERVRAEVHEAVARAIERPDSALDETVAYHLEQAALLRAGTGDDDRGLAREASERLGDVGVRALKRVDVYAAADLLTRAIALSSEDDEWRLELECMLGMAVKFAGDAERADALLEDVARASAAVGNARIEHLARVEQVWPRLARGALSVGEARSLLERALEIFAQGDDFALGRAWQCKANVNAAYEFRFGELEDLIARVHRHYERVDFASGSALHLLAVAAYRGRTRVPVAIERCQTLLLQAETLWESFLLPVLAVLEAMQGRFDDARRHLQEARVRREQYPGAGMLETSWAALAAEVELLASDPERAERILSDACARLRAVGEVEWLATNGAHLAEAQYRQGRWADALSTSETALLTGPPEHLTSKAIGRRVRATALARVGRGVDAAGAAEEAITYLEGTDVLNEHGETFAAAAEVHRLTGDLAAARAAWDQAIACFEAKGNLVSAARVRNAAAVLR